MTFSICVREEYVDSDGDDQTRFGVAVTTRLPGVGALCPFASEDGAVATQSYTNVELGRKGLDYLADGLAVDDALQALLNADDEREKRQLHGLGRESTFAFSGEECRDWYGHYEGENVTVAGNLLASESVVEATAAAYEGSDRGEPLAKRLIDALAAGDAEGGDRREDLPVQSAALVVASTENQEFEPYYNDLRVDATETPMRELRETFHEARRGYELALDKYTAGDE
ncbi:Uncharacterized conserved protein, Ntn-hydrolase superfamily [Halogranum amylolyticum]|uniref:Uncharacterized conserved protein, Ntn-hydrolase superfamily n=1 Tax=Halogranum amylolyticum TaxID=660520 RepID=A0A1H8QCI2_9EURY|nr:DUF1028 domain-containing protein [Halogranum amylolyticum]SEO51932.1 Uncharacterized conserved protein, Ntn-hydrolase superfamily [Halogranum amylolyticum]